MPTVALKVGELARRTGLTVRTLHFYEEIGLLRPGERTDGGHRLYGADEVERLQRITSMRQLGFTLEEIGDLLDGREGRADTVIERHVALLRAEIAHAEALIARLTRLTTALPAEPDVDDLLLAIEETVVHEPYFTADQLSAIERHRQELGPEGVEGAWKAWTDAAAEARAAQLVGTPPDHPQALAVARRWTAALDRLMPPDAAIRAAGGRMAGDRESVLQAKLGIGGEVRAWLHEAVVLGGRVGSVRVPGARLHYEVRGTGPVLVLLPGGDGDADTLRLLADHLVDAYAVVTLDRRGQTRSPVDDPAAPVTIEDHADDLHRVLAAVTTEPALVFGGSFGALVGLALAARHPDQVRTLVAHEAPTPTLLPEGQRQVAREAQLAFEAAYRDGGAMAAVRTLAASLGGLDLDDREPEVDPTAPNGAVPEERGSGAIRWVPASLPVLQQAEAHLGNPRRAANLAVLLTRDAPAARAFEPDLAALRNPRVVVAAGTRASWTHAAARALAERLGTELVEFPGGHNGYATRPRAFAGRLREVLVDPPDPVR